MTRSRCARIANLMETKFDPAPSLLILRASLLGTDRVRYGAAT
jgi:hypothetical protein